MKPELECAWDENLREIPKDPAGFGQYVEDLRLSLKGSHEPRKRVSLLGELGSRLRTLGALDQAEQRINEALELYVARKSPVTRQKKENGATNQLEDKNHS